MIKNVKPISFVLVFSSFISFSFVENKKSTEKLVPGDNAPIQVLENNLQKLELHGDDGDYFLLSFWSGSDAKSRMNNAKLCHAIVKHDKIRMVSVSIDENKSIFNVAIKQDGIDSDCCYNEPEGEKSKIFDEFDLKNGFANYLVDNKGKIIAKNISSKDLDVYVK